MQNKQNYIKLIFLFFFYSFSSIYSEEILEITVTKTMGNISIKREGERKWKQVSVKDQIFNNDIIKTSFKSNTELTFSNSTTIFLGSNTRILINYTSTFDSDGNNDVNVTVFEGSIFSKVKKGLKYAVYSSYSIATTNEANFNFTVDDLSENAGFHVLKGKLIISNLSIPGEATLLAGKTSVIGVDIRPKVPRAILARQMAVLSRFYGSRFIDTEVEKSGIELLTVNDDDFSRITPTDQDQEKSLSPFEADVPNKSENTSKIIESSEIRSGRIPKIKKSMSQEEKLIVHYNDISEKLKDYNRKHNAIIEIPNKPKWKSDKMFGMRLSYSALSYSNLKYSAYELFPAVYLKEFSLELELSMVSDSTGSLIFDNYKGFKALLDKINSLDYNISKKSKLHLGDINNISIGTGLVVDDFTNKVRGNYLQNTGLLFTYSYLEKNFMFYTSSILDFHTFGIDYFETDSTKDYGFALSGDLGNSVGSNNNDYGFRTFTPVNIKIDSLDSVKADISYLFPEFHGSVIFNHAPVRIKIGGSLAGMFEDIRPTAIAASFPNVEYTYRKTSIMGELYFYSNKFLRSIFNKHYEDNRFGRLIDSNGVIIGVRKLSDVLKLDQIAMGFGTGAKFSPINGIAVVGEFRKNFRHSRLRPNPELLTEEELAQKSIPGREYGMVNLRLIAGKAFWKRLSWFEVTYRKDMNGYFYDNIESFFKPNPLTSLESEISLEILTMLNVRATYDMYYYDKNGDFIVNSTDAINEFSFTLIGKF